MKRYRSIDYGRVLATADDPLIATSDSPRDAVPIALAAEPAVEIGHFDIYGHRERCRILARHGAGTIDVERLSDGRCFRVSGLPLDA
ncbi:hypothetical protein WT83_19195 [Burkholderia territorii]|uniref:Uncharacterized protein n=1 Tax=Burkholderia territorii TaxID=1503055 RepID=A0A125K5T5_9BURK|nr:hypothetical protein [Burkholderia territorii]KWN11719.1 hypothetical protein WT83_19195 [Burkholderia territorii]